MVFRHFTESDSQKVVELLNLCFEGQKITIESFLWKHFDAYFQGQTVAFVAEIENSIVGFVCFTPFELNSADHQLWVCAVQATHLDFRRQGIVKKLTQLCEQKIGHDQNYIGFSNESGVKIDQNSKSINYQILGQIQKIILVPGFCFCFGIKKVEQFESIYFENTNFGINKDIGFLKWKYNRNPKLKYKFLEVYQDQKLIAQVVVLERKWKVEIMHILADSKNTGVILKVLSGYYTPKLKLVSVQILENQFWKTQLPFCKLKLPIPTYFVVKSEQSELLNLENWNITGGDLL